MIMIRAAMILFVFLFLGAGCASSEESGFVVNGSTMIIPGQGGGEIRAGAAPLVPALSVEGAEF